MSTESARSLRRRLLVTAMPEGTSPETLQKSLDVLDQEFGDQSTLRYSQLVSRLEKNLDRAELNLSHLLGKLLRLKDASPDSLLPDPKAERPAVDARSVVFQAILGRLEAEAERRGLAADLRAHFANQIHSLRLSPRCGKAVASWARTGTEMQIEGSDDDLHTVINAAFVWYCNKLGPVDADRILLASVRFAESLPEAFECPPRTFL